MSIVAFVGEEAVAAWESTQAPSVGELLWVQAPGEIERALLRVIRRDWRVNQDVPGVDLHCEAAK